MEIVLLRSSLGDRARLCLTKERQEGRKKERKKDRRKEIRKERKKEEKKRRQAFLALWLMAIISATWEAEAGGSLCPGV